MLKKRTELPNFKKIDIEIDVPRLLACFSNWEQYADCISTECGTPYLNNGYNQTLVTEPSEVVLYKNGKVDERCYDTLKEEYVGTYVEEVLNMFKSRVTRVRLVVKEPGANILPHIDYDTTYSVRYYVPLQTNEWCFTAVKSKTDDLPEVRHLEADGSVWFVNPGNLHSAWNMGQTNDIRLILACDGQDDLGEE